jgi:hypothetical protein
MIVGGNLRLPQRLLLLDLARRIPLVHLRADLAAVVLILNSGPLHPGFVARAHLALALPELRLPLLGLLMLRSELLSLRLKLALLLPLRLKLPLLLTLPLGLKLALLDVPLRLKLALLAGLVRALLTPSTALDALLTPTTMLSATAALAVTVASAVALVPLIILLAGC